MSKSSTTNKLTLTFLGTGPAVAIPRFGHNDEACNDAKKPGSKTRRMRSSLLISHGDQSILIDAGPDFLKQAKYINDELKAVFLTHEHLDAAGGINDLREWAKVKHQNISIYCLPQTWKRIEFESEYFTSHLVTPGRSIKIGALSITPFNVRHGIKHNTPTLGFKISVTRQSPPGHPRVKDSSRISFVYASDMDGAPSESLQFFSTADVVVIDSAIWFGKQFTGHFNPEQALAFLKPLNPKKVVLTQVGHSWPPWNTAIKELTNYCTEQGIRFPVSIAYDGAQIIL